ncbi:MAG: hypothetical protein KH264_01515 [Actinomyces graevenitzii]|nr:hypothetical protein [Actinomyces graevenitzii]
MCTFKAAGRRRQNSGADKNAAQAKRKAAGRRRCQGTKPGTVAGKASAYQAAQAKYRFGQIRPKPVN